MTSQNSTSETVIKLPGIVVFIGVIASSSLVDRTFVQQMSAFLPGGIWDSFCHGVGMLLCTVFWLLVLPDILRLRALNKISKPDGAHEKM